MGTGGGVRAPRPTDGKGLGAGGAEPQQEVREAGRCGERTERCQWQKKRDERVAAVKISSVRRKAARKFWAPQQDHRPLRMRCKRCGSRPFRRFAPPCPPSCQPIPGHCRGRQSGHFLKIALLHPPPTALRRFPLAQGRLWKCGSSWARGGLAMPFGGCIKIGRTGSFAVRPRRTELIILCPAAGAGAPPPF